MKKPKHYWVMEVQRFIFTSFARVNSFCKWRFWYRIKKDSVTLGYANHFLDNSITIKLPKAFDNKSIYEDVAPRRQGYNLKYSLQDFMLSNYFEYERDGEPISNQCLATLLWVRKGSASKEVSAITAKIGRMDNWIYSTVLNMFEDLKTTDTVPKKGLSAMVKYLLDVKHHQDKIQKAKLLDDERDNGKE